MDKTHFLVFSRRKYTGEISLFINGQTLKQHNFTKFLGIYIDNKLNWSEHIKQTLIKLNRNIGIMYNVRNSLTKNTKLLLYYSMIHCHLHYGNIIWGSAYASSLRPVITAQKKKLCE